MEPGAAAGGKEKMPLDDQFWGDRYGQLTDPFGYTWSIGAPVRQARQAEGAQTAASGA